MHQHLADLVLLLHFGVVVFVVGGLAAVVAGNRLGWRWVNRPGWRWTHLGAIGFVVIQSWLGAACPLTVLENHLRRQRAGSAYEASFIEHWVSRVLFYTAPTWLFTLLYTVFGLAVMWTWWRWPPSSNNRPSGLS